MVEDSFILKDVMGLHARPAAMLMARLMDVRADVEIFCNGKRADGRDVMSIMALNTGAGDKVTFCIDGPDEEDALEAVREVLGRA